MMRLDFAAVLDDIDNNRVLKDFLPLEIQTLKDICISNMQRYNVDKIFAVSPELNDVRSHLTRVLKIGIIRTHDVDNYVTIVIKHRKRLDDLMNKVTGASLIMVSHLFGREIADYIFSNEIIINTQVMQRSFNDRQYWRYMLRKYEGTKYWFSLFKYLFLDCYHDDGEPSFARTRRGKRQMVVYLSPEWHNRLNDFQFFDKLKCSFDENVDFLNQLILSGDVELNPGPATLSHCMRYNNSSIQLRHEAQGALDDVAGLNKFLNTQLPLVLEQVHKMIDEFHLGSQNSIALADSKLKEDIRMLSQSTESAISRVEKIQSKILKTMLLCSLIVILRQMKWNSTALVTGIVGMLSLFGLPSKLINLFQRTFTHESENFGVDTVYGPLLGSIICYFIIGKLPKDSSLEQFSKKTNNVSRGLTGMMNLNRDIGKLWTQIKDFVISQISPLPDGFMSIEDELKTWSESIEHYTDIIVKKNAMIRKEDIIKIAGLLKQGIKLKKWSFENKCTIQMCQHIANMCRHAEQLYNYCDRNNTLEGGQRQRPLCIVLFGESQIGKSRLTYPLSQDLCFEAGYRKESDIEEQIYARQPETEFWDGYKGQMIVIRDDCLAAVDDVSKPNPELHETIRELNDFPYHLHMAALEDKNTFYSSKVVIMTINDIRSPIRSLSYPEAFFNRISDNMYEVIPHPDFAKIIDVGGNCFKTILDMVKVNAYLDKLSKEAGYRIPTATDIYTFQKYKKVLISGKVQFTPDLTIPLLNYDEFSTKMCKSLNQKRDDFVVQKDFMNRRLGKKMQAQVGGEIFFDCDTVNVEKTHEFGDMILNGLAEGKTLLEVEATILETDRANDFIEWRASCQIQHSPVASRLKYYSSTMFEEFRANLTVFFETCRIKIANVIEQYPALKYLFFVGTAAVGVFTMYRMFMREEKVERFVTVSDTESIDEDTFKQNCKWIKQQEDMSFEDNMAYWKENLIMREDKNKNVVRDNLQSIPLVKHHTPEGYSSPSQGKDKHRARHQVENYTSEGYNSPTQGKDKHRARHQVEIRTHESEGSIDTCAVETALSMKRNNMYSLFFDDNGEKKLLGNTMAIFGYNFLIPFHFVKHLQMAKATSKTKLSLTRYNDATKKEVVHMSFYFSEILNEDGTLNRAIRLVSGDEKLDAIIFCPSERSNVICHRSILKHFILKDEQSKLYGNMEGIVLTSAILKSVSGVRVYDVPLTISLEGHEYVQRLGYLYNGDTIKGDCGGLLMIKSKSIIRKICGLHVSGCDMKGEGYSVKLTQELLEEHLAALAAKLPDGHRSQCYIHINEDILKSTNCDIPPGVFPEIGKVKVPLHQSVKTVLRPSLIHGEITKPITKPAHLRPFLKDGILLNPAIKGLEKCGGITQVINPVYCDMARNYVSQKILCDYVKCGYTDYARVLTYEESIMGNDDTYISAMCRSTSPGYPFNSDPNFKTTLPGKQAWMGRDENFDFTSVRALELRRIVEQLKKDCLNGIITNVICADTMKDERRPIAKVDEGKTRMFSACPMHFVTLFRQYYVGFAAFIMHNRNHNGISVGTNVYNSDWDQIVRQIRIKGEKVLAGDFSNFDGSLLTQVLWLVYEIIEEFYQVHDENYKEEDKRIRYSLWIHIVNSIHVYGDNLYQWTHSQPSGNPFTVIINSVYNLLILNIAYYVVVERSNLSALEKSKLLNSMAYDRHISPIVYGDDNILNISNCISEIFNQHTLTDALKEIGHDYTEETKGEEIRKWRKLHEISFLKRTFRWDEDVMHFVAPLDINVIYEMINWVRGNSVDPVQLLRDNIETALAEASLHGFKTYSKFVNDLKANAKVITKVRPYFPTFGEIRLKIENFSPSDGFMG